MIQQYCQQNLNQIVQKSLIDANIIHDEFVLTNNMLKEYDNMKEKIKNLKLVQLIQGFQSINERMLLHCILKEESIENT